MRNRTAHVPYYAYIIAVILSIFGFVLFFSTALVLKIGIPYSHVLAALITVFLGFMFALVWPVGLWRWGILASSGFWLYFIAVFVSSMLHRNAEWLIVGEGLAVIAIASIGAAVGRRFRLGRLARTS
jgi:hypothetical protein